MMAFVGGSAGASSWFVRTGKNKEIVVVGADGVSCADSSALPGENTNSCSPNNNTIIVLILRTSVLMNIVDVLL
jgi:hypothetical protein